MVLTTGVRLGPYEIVAPLGSGGMGEVYRARDTRLGREVAVKVLPHDVSTSGAWRQRLEGEAKAISKLAHPHVCALFDIGREGEVDYLVMELLSGVTLAARLAKGTLPLEEVFRFGSEMASALAATHAVGIAHGDLKPSNVMVTKTGVKLLDFGVARQLLPPRAARDATWDSTVSHGPTSEVGLVGTLPYMAPEQFEGKAADASTDIFSLGAVLFEMATGRRAFSGDSAAEVMSAVQTSEPPPVSSVQPQAPPVFDRLVRTCLAKDSASRWNSAHDVGLVLRQLQDGTGATPMTRARRGRRSWLPWGMALLGLGAAVVVLSLPRRDGGVQESSIRFLVPPPPGNTVYWHPEDDSLAVSPDGSQLAYVAVNSTGKPHLWVRRLNDLDAHQLPTTEGARSVFWSPDGRSIGFFARGMLRRLQLSDEAAVVVCPVEMGGLGPSGSWGKEGEILFAAEGNILRVPATGGTPTVELKPDTARGESALRYPTYLPDGVHFLYLAGTSGRRVLMASAPGQEARVLMEINSKVRFAEPGFLLFAKEGSLLAQRFDWRKRKLEGAPFAVAQHVRGFITTAAAEFATSPSGTLVFQGADDAQRLVVLDLTGRELATVAKSGEYFDFVISPSGRRLAFGRGRPGLGTSDVWSLDLERGVETRLTSTIDNEAMPAWLPGERALLYSTSEGGLPHLVRRDLETGRDVQLLPVRRWQRTQDVSPDGREFLYTEDVALFRFPLGDAGTPSPVLKSTFGVSDVRYSPDGKYIALISDESGQDEAYITPYPGPGERLRISSSGAVALQWNRETGTLFYSDVEGRLFSVKVSTQPILHIGARTLLFTTKSLVPRPGATGPPFDVFPDGMRILVASPEVTADEVPLTVVVNWPAAAPN